MVNYNSNRKPHSFIGVFVPEEDFTLFNDFEKFAKKDSIVLKALAQDRAAVKDKIEGYKRQIKSEKNVTSFMIRKLVKSYVNKRRLESNGKGNNVIHKKEDISTDEERDSSQIQE